MLGLKIVFSLSPKCVILNPRKILGFYLLIYIKHKGTIGLWSNELTKAREKVEPYGPIPS